ncbi:MAG TPA: hypothetical protein VFF67_01910 [Thermoplasmata archaeon]|nr:hypothetical protein [Thermoplasmata archaeon]
MARGAGSILHQQALTVSALFTGLTLTALVLVLNSPHPFHMPFGPLPGEDYFEVVVTYMALLGVMSSLSMLSYLEIAGGMAETYSLLDSLGTAFFLSSIFGFMGALPLLLAPFTQVGAAVVVTLEVILVGTYFVVRRRPGRRRVPTP